MGHHGSTMAGAGDEFYLRYYVGHKGKFGHEFLEFEFRPDGKLRYANNSNYKGDTMIRKEVYCNECVLQDLKRMVNDAEIMKEDDNNWPHPDRVGRQELEIVLGDEHISFTTSKMISARCAREQRPRGIACVLLLGARHQVFCLLADQSAFQDQTDFIDQMGGQCQICFSICTLQSIGFTITPVGIHYAHFFCAFLSN